MSDEDFKYLVEEFGSKNLELLKQKSDYPYEYMNSFGRFNREKLSARKCFLNSTEDGKIGDDGNISDGNVSDGHICVKDYLNCEKTWDKLKIKNMGDYYDQYFKKYVLLLADFLKNLLTNVWNIMDLTLVIILGLLN